MEDKTWVSIIMGLAAWLGPFGGVIYKFSQMSGEIKQLKKENAVIRATLVSPEGEPLLVSYKAFDVSKSACQRVYDERYERLEARQAVFEAKIDVIHDSVVVLAERSKNARTRSSDQA